MNTAGITLWELFGADWDIRWEVFKRAWWWVVPLVLLAVIIKELWERR